MRGLERNATCHVDRAEALRFLGYRDQQLSADLETHIDEAVAACEQASKPAWCYRVFPVAASDTSIALVGSSIELPLAEATESLARAAECAIMTCTLGLGFERRALQLAAIDETAALVYDAAGSSLVEECADDCERAVHAYAASVELCAGQRTSPGYGGVPLELSPEIARALDAGKLLGVSATESSMLIPTKSVTAFVGLFEREEDARAARRSCSYCIVAPDCPYLKAGAPCYR